MASLAKNNIDLIQNSISYLHNISSLKFTPPTLKCVYLTKARLMELRSNVQLPSNAKRTTVRCQRCFLNLVDGPANYRIKTEEKKSKFARKVLVKRDKDKPLTKYQRKYLKRLKQFNGNQLVITCKFCKKESLIKLEKPKKIIASKVAKTSNKKKKVKKKDKFCGLNQKAVLSLTPETSRNFIPLQTNEKKNIKNKDKFRGLNEEAVMSLTPENSRNFYASDFIPLGTNEKKMPKMKLSKKKEKTETVKKLTKADIRQNLHKLKKKNKLKEFLKTSGSSKSSPSSNLKNFLQTL